MTDHEDIHEENLDICRSLYERDPVEHRPAILAGLSYCIGNNVPIPPWLGMAFLEACHKVGNREVRSWDDVFGAPVLKGQHFHTLRRNSKIAEPLWKRIRERHEEGGAITKQLFAEVGKEFGISATVAEELYYDNKELFEAFEESRKD